MSDYYQILGVNKDASPSEIKSSYRKLAIKYHPDRNPGDQKAEQEFKKISEAYAVLSDAEKKKQYDSFGDSGFHERYSSEDIFRGMDFQDIFSDLGFGARGGGGFDSILHQMFGGNSTHGASSSQRGVNVSYQMSISLLEAYKGCRKQVSYHLKNGSKREFNVFIPAGIQDGKKLRVAGKGESFSAGGVSGDLFIQIHVSPDESYKRVGEIDLETTLTLKPSELLLGAVKEVDTLEGARSLNIPAGLSPGVRMRMKGYGFPHISDKLVRGDLFVVIKCLIPKTLNTAQKKQVEELRLVGL